MVEQESTSKALPRLKLGLRIAPFYDGVAGGGRYLVEVGETCFVAGEGMRNVLTALAEAPETLEALAATYERQTAQAISTEVLADLISERIPDSLFDHTPEPRNKRPFIFSLNLIRESWVRPFSTRLGFLFAKPIALLVGAAFLVAEYLVLTRSLRAIQHPFQGWDLPLFYVAIIAATLFHELGHASACRRFECPHGDIGFALYFIYPAFYTDVTKIWRLPPLKRAVVDMGGVYFQAILVIMLTVCVMLTHDLFTLRLIWMMNLTMFLTLNPVFKMDGYWLLSDLSGLSNLHQQMSETYAIAARKLLRRPPPADAVTHAQGVRLKVLYAYVVLASIYYAFVAQFLYKAFDYNLRHYPRFAAHAMELIRTKYLSGDSVLALRQTAMLIYVSIWPFILSALACFMALRVIGFLCRTISGRKAGRTLTISMPQWAYAVANALAGRKERRG